VADVLFADVSSWQCVVNDEYPHPVLSIRSNDGTYRDPHFAANYAWATKALDSGKLKALIVYHVYRPNWVDTFNTIKSMIGTPHPRVAVMIDVESWNGQIRGDQSSSINSLYMRLVEWIGNSARVIAYGNKGDLDSLWPNKPKGIRLVVASYGRNVDYPGKLAHQFADNYDTPPFGPCDGNSADGYTIDQFCTAIGIGDEMSAEIEQMIREMHVKVTGMVPTRAIDTTGKPDSEIYKDDMLGWSVNADGYGWRNEQRLIALQSEVAALRAAISTLTAAVSADKDLDPDEFRVILDDALARAIIKVDVTGVVEPKG
jgi:hypothetical protein